MKKQVILKYISIVLCFFLISVSFSACNGSNDFYKGAKKHLKDKYGVKCDSLIYYEYPTDMWMGTTFGVVELTNGDRVIVSLADGNYADSYELLDLYDAWTEKLSLELGANVELISVRSDGTITFQNTAKEDRNIGSFLETSKKRYNASNVDEFEKDFYDFTLNEEIEVCIVNNNPTEEWMENLADKLEAYRNRVGAEKIGAEVYEEIPDLELLLYPDDYYRHANGNGREYSVSFKRGSFHRYDTHRFKNNTIYISLVYDH